MTTAAPRTQKVITNGVISSAPVTMSVPSYQLITPGGDTQVVGNFEYRIPIVGPVTLAFFGDAGMNKILRPSQLTMEPSRVERSEQRSSRRPVSTAGCGSPRARRRCACPPVLNCR